MELANNIHFDVLEKIFDYAAGNSVESLEIWISCLSLLGINSHWRTVFARKHYSFIIFEFVIVHRQEYMRSNLAFISNNSPGEFVKSFIVYAPNYMITGDAEEPLYAYILAFIERQTREYTRINVLADRQTMFPLRAACISSRLLEWFPRLTCWFVNFIEARTSTLAIGVLFSYDCIRDEESCGFSRSYNAHVISNYMQRYTFLFGEYVLKYSLFDPQWRHAVHAVPFNTAFLNLLCRYSLRDSAVEHAIASDMRLTSATESWARIYTPVDLHNHILCLPAVKFIQHNGRGISFDIFLVSAPDDDNSRSDIMEDDSDYADFDNID